MVAMEMATEAANIAVRAVTVRAENPLFQSMGVEETAMIEEVAAAVTKATMDTKMTATIVCFFLSNNPHLIPWTNCRRVRMHNTRVPRSLIERECALS